jgi:hypothetical protein
MIIGCNYGTGRYGVLCDKQAETYPIQVITEVGKPVPERGNGYWRWKPRLILMALEMAEPNTFVLYMDAGDYHHIEFFNWLHEYEKNNDQLFVTRGYIHREWTKGDCFEVMGCTDLMNRMDLQLEAGLIGLRNTDENIQLVKEWQQWMENDLILNDAPSFYPNHADFNEHRHDQSILTNLVLMRQLTMHYVPGVIWNYQ